MAEAIVADVAKGILGNLIALVTDQIGLAWGFKGELTRLRGSVEMIQAVLADAEKRQVREERVRLWLQRLKDVAYDADDVLDELAYELLRRKVEIQNQMKRKVCFFFSFSNPIAFRFKMANKVKTIHESLKRINDEANGFGLIRAGSINGNPETIPNRETDSFLDHSEVVGRKDSVSEIVKLVTSTTGQQLSVIPIVGMAGLGKTTLAKLVYNHELVKNYFDKKIWVCVSDDFDDKRILRGILESLTSNPSQLESKNAILQNLQKELQGKRYLLILDDVWNEDLLKWDALRGYDDECWSIIKKRVSAVPLTPDLEAIGRDIAKKCGGVPLVAKVLGGTMSLKKGDSMDDISHVRRLSIQSEGEIVPRISFSKDRVRRLRTLISNANVLGNMLSNFECLRVLRLSGSSIIELSESIGRLIHLRYWAVEMSTKVSNFLVSQNADRRIEELGQLNQLRGQLTISNLENVRDKEEARRANLAEKAKIDMLGFYWSASARKRREVNYNNDEDVLEGLQPHQNLKSLQIGGFQGKKFPSWMLRSCDAKDALSLFDNLIEIILQRLQECEEVPPSDIYPALSFLL
ncbi:putative disease resistance protein RGA3 [Quercus suber]|uniref:putative disease resistance protein RGA3 n=1 Tax=Quercus suber TaxID=58331 RepID=UPI0032DECE4F